MNVSPNGAPTFELIIVSPHFLHGYQHRNLKQLDISQIGISDSSKLVLGTLID